MDFWLYERPYLEKGVSPIAGVDEAGRGPLAGPVCAAAVILPPELVIPGLDDSKKLTEKRREALYPVICEKALAWSVAFASPREIDELNILNATYLAMNRAIAGLGLAPALCIIDGNRNEGIDYPSVTLVGGDGLSANIAAASVLAKVTRDRLMKELDSRIPGYGFAVHKGYGTKLHYAMLREKGPSPIHRQTFLRKKH